jgi:hypothetical protein
VANFCEYCHEPGFHTNKNQYVGFEVFTTVIMKTSVDFHQTTRRYILKDSPLQEPSNY